MAVHANGNAMMGGRVIRLKETGIWTKFVRHLTEATAVFNIALIKDHSICGYTGYLKSMSHGTTINPHDFHAHQVSPQIALLCAQGVCLCITGGFKVMYHRGPLDKLPQYRVPHEVVFATTDPVRWTAWDGTSWKNSMKKEDLLLSEERAACPLISMQLTNWV
ncbi:DUF362 domain-containing protein [Pajaroellobacter abortibovis]|uniref:DUF362 domain-containing protein n=1 Tax=Pajaroellobacter abortibovis TaxID=1882918 RepID=A0A1L6MYG0_9BACT|nr:DUF362 domain-containing protein [Pajaroellobacter abortibovis]APS00487.1 hypothetical protein BCY86_07210 [Pajaroellobacter abortibovis]